MQSAIANLQLIGHTFGHEVEGALLLKPYENAEAGRAKHPKFKSQETNKLKNQKSNAKIQINQKKENLKPISVVGSIQSAIGNLKSAIVNFFAFWH